MATVFEGRESESMISDKSNWSKFEFDKFYCESACPDNFEFSTDSAGFLTLPVKGKPMAIAIVGVRGYHTPQIALRFLPSSVSTLGFDIIDNDKIYVVSDRSSLWAFHIDNQIAAIRKFQERLKPLNNPFGKRSYEEISISKISIE